MLNYLRYRFVCGIFALALVSITAWGLFFGGGFNYSVDFTGGTQVLLRLSQPVNADQLKSILKDAGFSSVDVREFANNEVGLRVQDFTADKIGVGEKIKIEVSNALVGNQVELLSTDTVGPGVGEYLRWNSLKAIIIALLLMLLYIALRFKLAFSIGAVVALFHDALVIAA